MPLPFILGAAAVAAGAFGVKKGLDAREDMEEAQDLLDCAKDMSAEAESSIEKSRKGTAKAIENLGKTKIEILSTSMNDFVKEFSKIKNVDFKNSVGMEELKDFTPDSCDFENLQTASFKAIDLASGGLGGIAAGSPVHTARLARQLLALRLQPARLLPGLAAQPRLTRHWRGWAAALWQQAALAWQAA